MNLSLYTSSTAGMRKARVLPDPVLKAPTRSWHSSRCGMVWAWISVMLSKPMSATPWGERKAGIHCRQSKSRDGCLAGGGGKDVTLEVEEGRIFGWRREGCLTEALKYVWLVEEGRMFCWKRWEGYQT